MEHETSSAATSEHAPRVGGGQQGQRREEQDNKLQRDQEWDVFDLGSASYTPQMWMDDLARLPAESGDDPNSPHADVLSNPLHVAAASGRTDIVQFMLDKAYDKDALDGSGCTPLHEAAHTGHAATIHALLAAGADVRLRCHAGRSALHQAVGHADVGIARTIIEHGADVNAADAIGKTPLHYAAAAGRADMVSLLCLEGVDNVDVADGRGCTALHLAALEGHFFVTQALLNAGADFTLHHETAQLAPHHMAALQGHTSILKLIIGHGLDVNVPDGRGITALHLAAVGNKVEAIEVLVVAGANIDVEQDASGLTPLHTATIMGSHAAVFALVERGASLSKGDVGARTTLHFAAARAGTPGTADVVDHLLRRGADEKAKASNGQMPTDAVGCTVDGAERGAAEDVERVRKLLVNAPADRAWRRRGFLVLCRAHYPSGRVQLATRSAQMSVLKRTRSRSKELSKAEADWAGMASMLMGVGDDPISRMGDGADIVFETILGFL